MEKTGRDPSEFIDSLPERFREDIRVLDAEITAAMPGAERVMWEGVFWGGTDQRIIGYGALVQRRPRKTVEWFVVGLAAQRDAISLYVNVVDAGSTLAEQYGSSLGKVTIGRSAIGFRSLADVDLAVLRLLLQRAAAFEERNRG